MRFKVCIFATLFVGCSAATWADTFKATASRSVEDAGAPADASGAVQQCTGLATSKSPPTLSVTFPGHGTPTESVHVTSGAQSCDLVVDTDSDGILFVGDALPCATLLAVGTPASATATISGSSSPTHMLIQWSYSSVCTIDDDYSLEKQ
jgi:hypothetical protein